MSVAGFGDIGYFMDMPVEELVAVIGEVNRIMEKRRSMGTGKR